MIDKKTQQRIKEWVSKQTGQSYPISNQIVTKAIILKNSNRIVIFEQTHPNFVYYRRSKSGYDHLYIDSRTEELWRMIIANNNYNYRGVRYYKAIIDTEIDKEVFDTRIAPCLAHYACEVNFFDDIN